MSSQPPVRYENYPPEQGDDVLPEATQEPEPAPIVRVIYDIPPLPAAVGIGRRAGLGLVIGVSVAGILGVAVLGQSGEQEMSPGATGDPNYGASMSADAYPTQAPSTPSEVTVGGRYSATVPDGWEYAGDGGGGVDFTNGANRVSASSIEVPPSTLAMDDLAVLAKSHSAGFAGTLADPVDLSTAHLQRARLAGTGRFRGKVARLLAELWIDDTGSGLLVTRILTAKPSSSIVAQAQAVTDELSADF